MLELLGMFLVGMLNAEVAFATTYFENDMIMTQTQLRGTYGSETLQKVLQNGEIYLEPELTDNSSLINTLLENNNLSAAVDISASSRWAYRTDDGLQAIVPYHINMTYFGTGTRDKITQYLTEMESQVEYVKFVAWEEEGNSNYYEDYVDIVDLNDGCASRVGRVGGRQVLTLSSSGCIYPGTVKHEMLHAMGFYHEHSRGDRDEYVVIHWDDIESGAEVNFEKRADRINTLGTAYDLNSVMHYHRTEFAVSNASITAIDDFYRDLGASDIAQSDIRRVQLVYRCEETRDDAEFCDQECPCPAGQFPCYSDDDCESGTHCLIENQTCMVGTFAPTMPTPEPTYSPTNIGETYAPTQSPTTRKPTNYPTAYPTVASPGTSVTISIGGNFFPEVIGFFKDATLSNVNGKLIIVLIIITTGLIVSTLR